jgi:hypothetical protein
MPAPDTPLTGDALLAAVTDAMVALHKRYHHRAPATAKTCYRASCSAREGERAHGVTAYDRLGMR